jgi:hypothetical protein
MIAYLITIFLSLLVAVAELFTKFRDEPFDVLKKSPAWVYLLMNGVIACLTLYMLTKTNLFNPTNELDSLKAALTAGLGSTILMRSKFLKINLNGQEAAIGPEIIINVFLETLERNIDRNRALERKQIVEQCMTDIDFNKAKDYIVTTILASRQIVSADETKKVMTEAEKIVNSPIDELEKSYALGYLVLDTMGEKFLKSLFDRKNKSRFTRESSEVNPDKPENIKKDRK